MVHCPLSGWRNGTEMMVRFLCFIGHEINDWNRTLASCCFSLILLFFGKSH